VKILKNNLNLKFVDPYAYNAYGAKNRTNDMLEIYDKAVSPKIFKGGKAYIHVTNAFPKILLTNQQTESKPLDMTSLRNTTQFTSMEL